MSYRAIGEFSTWKQVLKQLKGNYRNWKRRLGSLTEVCIYTDQKETTQFITTAEQGSDHKKKKFVPSRLVVT